MPSSPSARPRRVARAPPSSSDLDERPRTAATARWASRARNMRKAALGNSRPAPVVPMTETEEQPVPTWEEVARQYGRFIYTVAYRLAGNEDDARDLVQETLLRVRTGLLTYRPGSMEGWLSRITTNVFLDEMRRRRRRPVDRLPEQPEALPPTEGADEALAASTISIDVQAAITALPDEYRV